jgi:hypothetical protein
MVYTLGSKSSSLLEGNSDTKRWKTIDSHDEQASSLRQFWTQTDKLALTIPLDSLYLNSNAITV